MPQTAHSPALWTLGIAALTLSGFSLWTHLNGSSSSSQTQGVTDEGTQNLAASLAKIEEGQTIMLARLESLRLRVQSLESTPRTQIRLSDATTPNRSKPRLDAADAKMLEATNPGPKMSPEEFSKLLKKMFRGGSADGATTDEQEMFWKLARTTTMIDDQIKDLRAAVRANPGSAEKRLALADAYVAKLLTVPDGPERGIFAIKAESQWKNILKKDPSNWQSQVSLGFSHSQYPDFMNKTGEAIEDFEKALKIQERMTRDKSHAVTYFQLALLYRKQAKTNKALAILREGNRRFPKDSSIRKMLDELQGR